MSLAPLAPIGITSTDFQFRLRDEMQTPICGRNMSLSETIEPRISIHRQEEEWQSKAPENERGFSWKVKYGFIGISVYSNSQDFYAIDDVGDGINQQGLSGAILTLNETKYQTVPKGSHHYALTQMDLLPYILSTCSNVKEVEEALRGKYVWGAPIPGTESPPALHYSFHDKEGNNLVLEYIDGFPYFTLNPQVTVVTSDPPLPQQIENFLQYEKQSREQPFDPIQLPRDCDSKSRYITTAKLIELAQKCTPNECLNEGIELAQSILGKVQVIKGEQMTPIGAHYRLESTLWSVIKVLGEKIALCYYSKSDPAMKRIELEEIDFTPSKEPSIKVPIGTGKIQYINSTNLFKVAEKEKTYHSHPFTGYE